MPIVWIALLPTIVSPHGNSSKPACPVSSLPTRLAASERGAEHIDTGDYIWPTTADRARKKPLPKEMRTSY